MRSLAESVKSNLLFVQSSRTVSLKDYYNSLTSTYTGLIRDRLLAEFFKSHSIMENTIQVHRKVYDSLVTDAWKYASSAWLTSSLKEKGLLKSIIENLGYRLWGLYNLSKKI